MAETTLRPCWNQSYEGSIEEKSYTPGPSLERWPGPALLPAKVELWPWNLQVAARQGNLRLFVEDQLGIEPGQPYWTYELLDPHGYVFTTEQPVPLAGQRLTGTVVGQTWVDAISDPISDLWWWKFTLKFS